MKHIDCLSGRHDSVRAVEIHPFSCPARAKVLKCADQKLSNLALARDCNARWSKSLSELLQDQLALKIRIGDGMNRLKIEAPFKGAGDFMDAPIPEVGRSNHIKAWLGHRDSIRPKFW